MGSETAHDDDGGPRVSTECATVSTASARSSQAGLAGRSGWLDGTAHDAAVLMCGVPSETTITQAHSAGQTLAIAGSGNSAPPQREWRVLADARQQQYPTVVLHTRPSQNHAAARAVSSDISNRREVRRPITRFRSIARRLYHEGMRRCQRDQTTGESARRVVE